MFRNTFYNTYQKNVYSQNGEDGILEEILKRLNIESGWVCEFGAWDGIHFSNTFRLIESGAFQGVFIEGDPNRFQDLLATQSKHPGIVAIQDYVDHEPGSEHTLDNLLAATEIPVDFDILSIDIDSFDYQVWDTVEKYRPKIVVIEINSGIPPYVETHIHTPGSYDGTSFLPMYRLGIKKGYEFVLHTGNMIFVRSDLYPTLGLHYSNPLENFRTEWL